LLLLKRATRAGSNISQLVLLPDAALLELLEANARREAPAVGTGPAPATAEGRESQRILQACLTATLGLDASGLEATLRRAGMMLPLPVLTDEVLAPLLRQIGVLWSEERLSPAHEHAASAVVRRALDDVIGSCRSLADAPAIVVGTPAGQRHELGAMLAAAVASASGWRVIYLGADLPAAELARAVKVADARAVALSIVHPARDARLRAELETLADSLPTGIQFILGGGAAAGFARHLRRRGVLCLEDLAAFRAVLDRLASIETSAEVTAEAPNRSRVRPLPGPDR
jgi:methanogenic corrinoid protein MtbC1